MCKFKFPGEITSIKFFIIFQSSGGKKSEMDIKNFGFFYSLFCHVQSIVLRRLFELFQLTELPY